MIHVEDLVFNGSQKIRLTEFAVVLPFELQIIFRSLFAISSKEKKEKP